MTRMSAGAIWVVLLLVWFPISNPRQAQASPPNVVVIVADDLGGRDLGCYGSTYHKTPNLDQLSKQSVRFTQAYAASPVCSPTRVAILTGKHPARVGLTDYLPGQGNRNSHKKLVPSLPPGLALEEITLAERFRQAGYQTGIIGKWHLGGDGFEPTRQGFDINIAGDSTGTPLRYFSPFIKGDRKMIGLEDAPPGEYLTDRLALEAERFLESHKASPFFLYLPHYAVHIPMVAKPDLVDHYPKWDGTPHGRQENPTYAAMLESLDSAVGRVISTLDRLGLSENTILVFTSDNGGLATREGPSTPATNNSPLREGKGWLYEGGLRVPLLIRFPGRIKPGVEETNVWAGDLMPTLLSLCGLPVPDSESIDGRSLAPTLLKEKNLPPRALYWHYPHYSNQGGKPGGAIRDGDWKLIRSDEDGHLELFKLGPEGSESTNLVDKHPDKVKELDAKLQSWRKAVSAKLVSPNPNYVPNPQASDGSILLHASTAEVHGVMLRFEPLPHKETLGYWVRADDWASWDFEVSRPGSFEVEALVGCGDGSGGSVVEFRVGDQTLRLTVPVTGGFQAFKPQVLGRITIEAKGRHRLEVRVVSKPGAAVMDLRRVTLTPISE